MIREQDLSKGGVRKGERREANNNDTAAPKKPNLMQAKKSLFDFARAFAAVQKISFCTSDDDCATLKLFPLRLGFLNSERRERERGKIGKNDIESANPQSSLHSLFLVSIRRRRGSLQ